MAHYAKLDENNIVTQVIVIGNQDEMKDGVEDEETGIAFCAALTGHQNWIKTSYNNNIRKRYAGIGYTYDESKDAFIPPKLYPSWILNDDLTWEAPIPMPDDNQRYIWDEMYLKWRALPPMPTPTPPISEDDYRIII